MINNIKNDVNKMEKSGGKNTNINGLKFESDTDLNTEYDVHHIDLSENKIVCHQSIGGSYITTITII